VYQIELLSRQVMRVVIPKGVQQARNGLVDIHVATPYGVSPALSIPIACGIPSCVSAHDKKNQNAVSISMNPVTVAKTSDSKPAIMPADGYSVKEGDIAITYKWPAGQQSPQRGDVTGKINLAPVTKLDMPGHVTVSAELDFKDFTVTETSGIVKRTENGIVIDSKNPMDQSILKTLVDDLFKKLMPPFMTRDKMPPFVKGVKIQVTDVARPDKPPQTASGTINVVLIQCK
jgi:hypothetical protein